MSINWVMLDPSKAFVHLPNENRIFTSPPRTSISITTPRSYPGDNPISIESSTGTVYLTNQRIVYLPAKSTPTFQSFSAPLSHLHDSHVTAPFFGPNAWYAVLQPVPGGGIASGSSHIEVKMTFKDGGAYDFHTNFEQVKERYLHALEEARERGIISGTRGTAGVDMSNVNLDELPAYDAGSGPAPPISSQYTPTTTATSHPDAPPAFTSEPAPPVSAPSTTEANAPGSTSSHSFQSPAEPPPGYEETQQQSIAEEVERQLAQGR